MVIFRPIAWVNPFGKMSVFSNFRTSCFYSLERHFLVLEYHKTYFPGLYCLKKKKLKNFHYWTKSIAPLENFNFSTFWTFCLYSLERYFFVLEYHKRHFPGLYCLKKRLEKRPFLDQNHGLTPLEKWKFFDFLNFLF